MVKLELERQVPEIGAPYLEETKESMKAVILNKINSIPASELVRDYCRDGEFFCSIRIFIDMDKMPSKKI